MAKLNRKICFPAHLRLLLWLFGSGMVVFTLFRLILLVVNIRLLTSVSLPFVSYALFNRGLLFDAVTMTYLLTPAFLILSFFYLLDKRPKNLAKTITLLQFSVFLCSLAIAVADIPFFKYYNSRINVMILAWTDDLPLMFHALLSNLSYILYISIFIALAVGLYLMLAWVIGKEMRKGGASSPFFTRIIYFLISVSFAFLGIRGDINPAGMPIQVKHAFETNFPFVNQLGLNGVFNFMHTFSDFHIDYFSDEVALQKTRHYLGVRQKSYSPVAREISFNEPSREANVVIVIMESMSASQMGRFGNVSGLSPVLDSLAENGLSFDSVFTAGIHTYNGVFSTLFGLPALMQNKPTMSTSASGLTYAGISNVLKSKNYQTAFFTNGPKEFDNFGGFLPGNGIEVIVDEKRYPKEKKLNNWGVGDHYMFEYSIDILDSFASLRQPFLGVYMTVSTHSPYTLPPDIPSLPMSGTARDQAYRYADWSIGHFLRQASVKSWFSNTIFVFVADHGQNFDPLFEIPLSYHHTPLIFYSPSLIEPQSSGKLGLQIDIFPTIMGLLRIPYLNNTLGIDLMRESRPYAYFSADYKLGVLDHEYYLIIDKEGRENLYNYKQRSLVNEGDQQKDRVVEMKAYAYSMLQTMQFMINHKMTGLGKK